MHRAQRTQQPSAIGRWIMLLLPLVVLPFVWAALGSGIAGALREVVLDAGPWGEALFVLGASALIALCAPASLIYVTAGAAFGVAYGTLWAALAAVLGSTLAFGIARSALGARVARLLARSARLARFERLISRRGLWLTLLLRLSVVVPIGPVSYGIGLTRTRVRDFLLTSPAVLPAVFTYVYAGELAHGLLGHGGRARAGWEWALLALGLVATIGAAVLVARAARSAQRGSTPAPAPTPVGGNPRVTAPPEPDPGLLPPLRNDDEGRPRAVGVEIEFLRLQLNDAAAIIAALFGGRVEQVHERAFRVAGTRLGDFQVELDSHALSELAVKRARGERVSVIERCKAAVLSVVARRWTPSEITTEPIRCEQLGELDPLVHALGRAGAAGTDDGWLAVVGVHFNPSAPTRDAGLLRDYIRAYLLLHEHLREALQVDPARRALRFATAYPAGYRQLVLAPDYAPDMAALIDDYLRFNATRNRGLDLLPLFAHIAPEQVSAATGDPRIKPRPTFHFRLPNSQVGDLDWRITDEWRVWLEVERLAVDPRRLSALAARARRQLDGSWLARWQRWLALAPGRQE